MINEYITILLLSACLFFLLCIERLEDSSQEFVLSFHDMRPRVNSYQAQLLVGILIH